MSDRRAGQPTHEFIPTAEIRNGGGPRAERLAFVECARGRFAYLSRDPEEGAEPRGTVLYLHGFPDCPWTSGGLLDALAARGYRVRAPFLRGYHPSPLRGSFALEELSRDVLALLDALCPEGPAHLLGHDWGAVLTYATCAQWPARVASAVTMAVPHPLAFLRALARPAQLRRSAYMLFFQLPIAPEWAIERGDFAWIDRLWRLWSPGYVLPPEVLKRVHETLRRSEGAPLEYYRAMTRPPGQALRRLRGPLAKPIRVPVLHLQGTDDGCIGLQACDGEERFFEGTFVRASLASVGHFLPQEIPDRIAVRADAWFTAEGSAHLRTEGPVHVESV